ncbi:MAG: excalibur calcium-binding domain-containing protein [Boseongicola sp.]|nr:excalibur calcium-binding domain-containing protein [Boseongicola sp.]
MTKHLRRLLFEEWSPNPDTRRSDHAGPNARSFAAGRWGTAIRGVATQLLRMRHAVFAALAAVPVAGPGLLWDAASAQAIGESWRGLTVSQESRCTPYARRDYPYSGSVEAAVIASMDGRVYGPYTGRYFASGRQTDVEHIVAVSEAHDSGLCAAEPATRRRFSGDLLNLTLAAPKVNRCGHGGKCGYDAGEWLPPRNVCWFAGRVVAVKLKYDLTVDMREAAALEQVLSGCLSTELVFVDGEVVPAEKKTAAQKPGSSGGTVDALGLYDDNGNGHITCAEARRHGIAPVPRDHPAYRFMTDGDGDGIVCEARGETVPTSGKPAVQRTGISGGTVDALGLYDDNGNGHITCAEARRHGIAPVPRDHPAYRFMTDGDGDGIVCEARGETVPTSGKPAVQRTGISGGTVDALGLYDDNGNGHITCAEARRHGIAPVPRGHPAYRFMTDGDGDGVVCE